MLAISKMLKDSCDSCSSLNRGAPPRITNSRPKTSKNTKLTIKKDFTAAVVTRVLFINKMYLPVHARMCAMTGNTVNLIASYSGKKTHRPYLLR